MTDQPDLFEAFPPASDQGIPADQKNPAIRLYGRRFYKDQTPVEYLAEFLMVFASRKVEGGAGAFSLAVDCTDGPPCYWPEDHVALKLFAFFPSSKLDTRHFAHRKAYGDALNTIKSSIQAADGDKDEIIRLLQSLFAGFVGVAKNRTWVTQSFLPAANALLAREITWSHPKALANKSGVEVVDWESSQRYFDRSTHNFFGRGGELLFLQLVNLFADGDALGPCYVDSAGSYKHLAATDLPDLRSRVEASLKDVLSGAIGPVNDLVHFIEARLGEYKLRDALTPTRLGWVPKSTRPEALLFAVEMDNICTSMIGEMEKLELLKTLCAMQVLRSLCFQARRIDEHEGETPGFIGNYVWVTAPSDARTGSPARQTAQGCYERIAGLLFRALRSPKLLNPGEIRAPEDLKNGDDNCLNHFRKMAKELGLVIPRTGVGQRFVLPPALLRFLVAALIPPGQRVRLNVFYERVFAHYGIALGSQQLATALHWMGGESGPADYAVATDTGWLEEALQQGGFLVELSDAVSMVHNPGAGRDAA